MAQFSVEINDADVSRVLDAIAVNYNRPETVSNPSFDPALPESESNSRTISNPENKSVFANRKVRDFLIEHVDAYEAKAAKQAALDALPTSITITDPQL
mgnify:CR=1 FL=1